MNLALRFFLELALLISLGYWGFHVTHGILAGIGLGLGIPVVVAIIWGTFLSPKAAIKIPAPGRLIMEIMLFGCSVLALYSQGHSVLSGILGIAFLLNRYLLYRWKAS